MKLSQKDADLYFKLMVSLQFFVNKRHNIFPEITTIEAYVECTSEQKKRVRDALYTDINLIDGFIAENPHALSQDELHIVKSWKLLVSGDFFVERLLKKYAIFIDNDKVYAVLALYDPFQDIFAYASLPVYIKAVLLPFKDKIIYDGLLEGYSIHFGGGIKSNLKEAYMTAKQNGRIIESLIPPGKSTKPPRQRKPSKDWRQDIDELRSSAKKLRSSAGDPPIFSPAFSLPKASIEMTRTAVNAPEDLDELWRALKKVERAVRRVETTLNRAES